ncbi:hypothetical protein [Candidatus Finniella inopinata]|uniref:Serine protease n=1 Tax=Candidatus Finniella inopinata TaxID=1696036 RepID=A0A4Q7DGW6_9PROT|nr:hypothetical protein [Candidatus Finniella inopinata]RZI45468.1 hypothetical protein EQU50_06905 [Candidatus Finniella inopinata]
MSKNNEQIYCPKLLITLIFLFPVGFAYSSGTESSKLSISPQAAEMKEASGGEAFPLSVNKYEQPIKTIYNDGDDRVPSNDPKVVRIKYNLYPGFEATVWLASVGCCIGAGHTLIQYNPMDLTVELNVRTSQSNGTLWPSPEKDTYQVDLKSIVAGSKNNPQTYQYGYRGNDWGCFLLKQDSSKQPIFERQKSFFRITKGDNIFSRFSTSDRPYPLSRITGYGRVPDNRVFPNQQNSKNLTQQTASGTILGKKKPVPNPPQPGGGQVSDVADSDIIYHQISATAGNSGSPMYLMGTHMAIGIHTASYIPGQSFNDNNDASGFNNSQIIDALKRVPFYKPGDLAPPTSVQVRYVDSDYFAVSPTDVTGDNSPGGLFNPYRSLEDARDGATSGDTLGITAGYYAGGGITFPLGKKLALKALAGKVYIGAPSFHIGSHLPPINPPSLAVSDTMSTSNIQQEEKKVDVAIHEKRLRKYARKYPQAFRDPIKPDTRVLSNDPRVGRILKADEIDPGIFFYDIIGTGSLISSGCILTAGRIFNNIPNLYEQKFYFEVNIDENDYVNIIDIDSKDAYEIDLQGLVWDEHVTPLDGDDWSVFRVKPNMFGESIFQNQKFSFRPIANWRAPSTTPDILFGLVPYVRTTGHGQISDPSARYLIQQTNSAQVDQRNTSPTGGSDAIYSIINTSRGTGTGSPVYLIGTHMIIGISSSFTSPATPTDNGVDISTGFTNTRLVDSIKKIFHDSKPLTYVDSDYFCVLAKHADGVTDGTGDIFAPYRRLEDALSKASTATSSTTLGIVSGYYINTGRSDPNRSSAFVFPKAPASTGGKNTITLKAISGKVYIGGILPQPGQQPPFGDTSTTEAINNKHNKESASVFPIEEPFAPASSSSGEEDIFSSLGDFGLPIGSVLDWWSTNISSMPACFELCNGQKVLDRESPLFGQYLPNLNHGFTRGTIDPQEVGHQGGHSKAVVSLTTSENGAHRHQFSDNRGMTDLISRATTAQDIYMHEKSEAASHNHGSWTHSQESGSSVSHRKGKGVNHRHSLPGTDSGGAHTHTITATVDISPPYVNVLKIMRIK